MCGVVAILGKKSASSLVIDGLKKLEYRGYDSAGIATLSKRSVQAIKSEGKLNNLINSFSAQKKEKSFFENSIAIGHTRWATHGNINIKNAHPLISDNKVAVVHNGIIENHVIIKKQLLSEGFTLTVSEIEFINFKK